LEEKKMIDVLDREEISNRTEIEKLLEDIRNSIIGFENFKQYFEKIKNSDQVIMSQIENLTREYKEYKTRFTTEYNKDSHKQLIDDGFVRLDIFEDARMMNKILLEAYNWKTLQEELHNIIFQKIYRVLDDARALDIKRDTLKEMREMEETRQKMFVEIMNNMSDMFKQTVVHKLQNYEEKFLNLVMMVDEDNRRDRKEIFDTLREIVNTTILDKEEKNNIVKNIYKDDIDTKRARLYPDKKQKQQIEETPYIDDEDEDDDEPKQKTKTKISDIEESFEEKKKPIKRRF